MEPSPVFYCQSCRARIVLLRGDNESGTDSFRKLDPAQLTSLNASVFDSSKIDESFIVLDDRRAAGTALPQALPSSSRGLEESFVVLPGSSAVSALRPVPAAAAATAAAAAAQGPNLPGGSSNSSSRDGGRGEGSDSSRQQQQQPGLLPGPATAAVSPMAAATAGSSVGATAGAAGAAGLGAEPAVSTPPSAGGGARDVGFDAKLEALAALCDLASTTTGVDHPLCLDCVEQLKDELAAQVTELEDEIAAYSTALEELEAQPPQELSQAEFEAELASLAAQTAAAKQEQLEAERSLTSVTRELTAQQAIAADIAALEERYWHDLNEYQLSLQQHLTDRDSLLNKIDRAGQQLLLLKSTNVLNDMFRIWHDGPFGTISGFRLGRTPECAVEWDEINAAWGQAVLLLHTMAQQCKLNFSAYRLLPMGSHPRVADKRGTYDLFGPVNKLWSSTYDKAIVAYLACLKEFGDFARARDVAESQPTVFEFPFPIEGDKVGNYTVKLSMLNKDAKWTKALKLLLADLKVALQWMIQQDVAAAEQAAGGALPSLGQEGPTHALLAS